MFLQTLLVVCAVVFGYMSLVFVIARLKNNNSLVDIAWGFGFVLIASISMVLNQAESQRQLLMTFLVASWGIRLAIYLLIRNSGRPEDKRYVEFRKKWKKNFALQSFFKIFMLQALLMIIISLPVINTNSNSAGPLSLLNYFGALIWSIGFLYEVVADFQLFVFKSKSKNKGRVLRSGLWKYSRHPNYFGEMTLWWGIFLLSVGVSDFGYTIVGPILITFLLLKVSGVTLLEKHFKGNSEYTTYQRQTSGFIPLPPKK